LCITVGNSLDIGWKSLWYTSCDGNVIVEDSITNTSQVSLKTGAASTSSIIVEITIVQHCEVVGGCNSVEDRAHNVGCAGVDGAEWATNLPKEELFSCFLIDIHVGDGL